MNDGDREARQAEKNSLDECPDDDENHGAEAGQLNLLGLKDASVLKQERDLDDVHADVVVENADQEELRHVSILTSPRVAAGAYLELFNGLLEGDILLVSSHAVFHLCIRQWLLQVGSSMRHSPRHVDAVTTMDNNYRRLEKRAINCRVAYHGEADGPVIFACRPKKHNTSVESES